MRSFGSEGREWTITWAYPSQDTPNFTHLWHFGFASSHLTRRFLSRIDELTDRERRHSEHLLASFTTSSNLWLLYAYSFGCRVQIWIHFEYDRAEE